MRNWIKIIIVIAGIGIAGLAYVWFFVYNKPHRNIEKSTPDFVITASDCYQHYVEGQNTEIKNYTGKVLQITGIPSSIESNDSLMVVVFVFNNGMFGDEGIRCTLLPSYNKMAQNINLTEMLTIKGYCSGYNDSDVIIEQCSIIRDQ